MWYEGPDKWIWIAYMVILTVISEIVCFKGMKMIDRYFNELNEEEKEGENPNTDSRT